VLILTRKTEQAIVIDGQTIVRVLSIEGERVKLGIDAPKSITVLREELVREIAGANREAAGVRDPAAIDSVRRLGKTPDPDDVAPSPQA